LNLCALPPHSCGGADSGVEQEGAAMISELQAIFGPDLLPMFLVNGVAAVLGVCFMIVALSSGAESSRATARATARI
jgi:hypothetical protein